jgi:membrane protease YdiL (CAAX protease family)
MRAVGLGLSDIKPRTLYWALGGFAAALPTVFGLSLLSQLLLGGGVGESNPLIPMLVSGRDWETRLPLLLNVVLLAPLFEEFLFRGFLLSQFRRHAGESGAVMLSALMFGAMHMSPDALLPLTGLGVILAIVARASGGLWAPVLLHSLWNAATMATVICLYD